MTESTKNTTKRDKALREAYGAATKRLRDKYRDEFEQIRIEEAAQRGERYEPKPKPEQVAEQQVEQLLGQFPQLREKFGLGESEPSDPPTAGEVASEPRVVEHL